MKRIVLILGIGLLAVLAFARFKKEPAFTSLEEHLIIPRPVSVTPSGGNFEFNNNTTVRVVGEAEGLEHAVDYLSEMILRATGFKLERTEETGNNQILIQVQASNQNPEGYQLEIQPNGVSINAPSAAGVYYGVQSIRQLLPKEVETQKNQQSTKWALPAGRIEDAPVYEYRGAMLDVSRHFFPVEDVKHLIDQLAKYKINKLHLHLSDDQGWRIEIKSWPLLTTIGGSTQVGGGEGGFYTQEDYKDIVAYAQSRFITIVPEIDMPGHTNAATAAYGILNPGIEVPEDGRRPVDRKALGVEEADEAASELYTGMKVGFSTLATDRETTYQFIDDVIRELAEMTPGPYIHIGGDESHVTEMEDYIPFIERAQEIVKKYGKTSIGWDEVAHANLAEGTIAQFWAKEENAKMAADQGNQLLMSPSKHAYLDMKYDSATRIGLTWAAVIDIDVAYDWEPTELLEGVGKDQILGVEAPLWTETVENREDIEYLVFPRVTAIAEIGWTPKEKRNWENYKRRLQGHTQRWDIMGINYYESEKLK